MRNDSQMAESGRCGTLIDLHARQQRNYTEDKGIRQQKHNKLLVFGKLRNSLLSQNADEPKSAGLQLGVGQSPTMLVGNGRKDCGSGANVGACGDAGNNSAMNLKRLATAGCGRDTGGGQLKHHPAAEVVLQASQTSKADFDDNFILRRKTPNAGLKTYC